MFVKFKGSAIHNLVITGVNTEAAIEGIYLGKDIMHKANIMDGEEIIITRIGADSWGNRIKTIAFASDGLGVAEVCGSLSHFLNVGEKTCVIAEIYNSKDYMDDYNQEKFPIFDLGFNPDTNNDNLDGNLDFQYFGHTVKGVNIDDEIFKVACEYRNTLLRAYVQSMICGLRVNKTHPDCLQGSAELPGSVMEKAGIQKYKSVSVYNNTQGGIADTYAVSMPEGVVMTTGAMASFAKIGECVNIVSFVLDTKTPQYCVVNTDGTKVIE